MMVWYTCFLFSIIVSTSSIVAGYNCEFCQPEQVHIAFGAKPNDIVVTWTTFNKTKESRVQYGIGSMDQEASGIASEFVDNGTEKRHMYIHRVTLPDLKFDTTYVYHVGSVYGWSELFSFKTPPQGEDWVLRAAIYGDMGNRNAHSLSYLQDEAQRGHFDVILHVGDFAYDMHDDNARVGDEFMRQIQPLAAAVPYMVCPGNHEQTYNFSNYRARFSMPGDSESLFYSWNLGPVHFVSITTEVYYFLCYGVKLMTNQYDWLREDLTKATLPENRQVRPWIIMYGHRPMVCTNMYDDCKNKTLPNRVGINGTCDELGTRARESDGIVRRSNFVVESDASMDEDFIQESDNDSLSAQDASAVEESEVEEAGFEGPVYVSHQCKCNLQLEYGAIAS